MSTEAVAAPLVRRPHAEIGAVLSGALYCLAFAGFDQWYLTFVALVPLWISLQGQTVKRATWLGFLTGLTMNLGGFYWLTTMLQTFSGFPLPLCMLFVVIICAYQGGRFAFFGWLYGRAAHRGWPAPLVFAGAFATSELVFPLLFPWYYAATVHQVSYLTQVAELGGPILIGLVLVAVNLAVAEPFLARMRGVAPNRRVLVTGAAALVLTLVFSAIRIPMVNANVASAESVRAGFVQGNMGLMQKRERPGEGLRRHVNLTRELRDKGVDFVVWSESSVTFPVNEERGMNGHFYRDSFAASLGMPAIFGGVLVHTDPDPTRDRWFNTAIATDVRGEVTGRYDKHYLLAFGEYLPFGQTFPILYKWSPHSGRFTPGTDIEPVDLEVKGQKHKVSVLICYEDILPYFTNNAVKKDTELLVNITNDAWFGDTAEPWEHLALAKFRAIEHRRFLVRSTNSGVSAIVDPVGRIVTSTKTFVADAQQADVHWMKGTTVYEVVGDVPYYLITLGIVVAAFRRRQVGSA